MPISIPELRTAVSFLRMARGFVEDVRDIFRGHDADCTARLGDIMTRLTDEREYVERLISKPTNGSAKNG